MSWGTVAWPAVISLFTIGIVQLTYKVLLWIEHGRLLRSIPAPRQHWLLGCLGTIAAPDHHLFLRKWAAELGGIYSIRLGPIHAVVVSDPSLVADVLGRGKEIDKSVAAVYSKFNQLLHAKSAPNIFTSYTNDYWKMIRKGVAPAFNPINLRNGFHHIVNINMRLIEALHAATPERAVDMDNAAQRVTLDVIGRVGFDKDFGATGDLGSGSANEAFDLMGAGRDEGLKRWHNPLRPLLWMLPSVRKGEADYRRFRALMMGLLKEVQARGPPPDADMSIAAHLLRICDPATGNALPDDRLAAEIGVFFTGGFETTGHTIAWALLMISQHRSVEQKVLAELGKQRLLASASNPEPRAMTHDDLALLPYTANAIKEAMRLLPVLSDGTNRTAKHDIILGGHHIPKGTMIWIPFNALFNSPHNWEAPGRYWPERWEQPDAEAAIAKGTPAGTGAIAVQAFANGHQRTTLPAQAPAGEGRAAGPPVVRRWLPFSMGTRDCIGQSLARMNYLTTVAMLIARFEFRLHDRMRGLEGVLASQSMAQMTLAPRHGLWMHAIPRSAVD